MTTMTVDLPDSLFFELEQAAASRHVSTESLPVELTWHDLKEIKSEQHLRERAARGNPERGLSLLDKIAQRSQQTTSETHTGESYANDYRIE